MGKNKISISAIIPLYNANSSIIPAIESVTNQSWLPEKFELIIVDDGSTDNSKELVQKWISDNQKVYGFPIKVVSQKNGGVAHARNTGIRASSFEWVAFLDSDDIWDKHRLEKFKRILGEHPQIDFLGGNLTSSATTIPFFGKLPYLYRVSVRNLLVKWVPQTSTVTVRKSVLIDVGMYDDEMRYAEDGDLYLKIAAKFNYYVVQERFATYGSGKRMYGESGLSGNMKGMFKGNLQILKHALQAKEINSFDYVFFLTWNSLKYVRRILITMLANRRQRRNDD